MNALFQSGRIVDGILALMLLELLVLRIVRKKTGHGMQTRALALTLGAGAALLLALRCALSGDSWQAVALWLIAALLAHLLDLGQRWRAR